MASNLCQSIIRMFEFYQTVRRKQFIRQLPGKYEYDNLCMHESRSGAEETKINDASSIKHANISTCCLGSSRISLASKNIYH